MTTRDRTTLDIVRESRERGKWVIYGRSVIEDGEPTLVLRITEADRARIERALTPWWRRWATSKITKADQSVSIDQSRPFTGC